MFFLVDVSVCMRGAGGVWRLVLIELKQDIKTNFFTWVFWSRTILVTVCLDLESNTHQIIGMLKQKKKTLIKTCTKLLFYAKTPV